jgi:3-oxoacyl-[acyl-carrier-protein] synthase II
MVGASGFEPPTTRSRTVCSTRLSYAPTQQRERLHHTPAPWQASSQASVTGEVAGKRSGRRRPRPALTRVFTLYFPAMVEVWVTGIGIVSSLGGDRESTWRRLLDGESGIRPLTAFDPAGFRSSFAAQVDDQSLPRPPAATMPRHTTRASRFALAATAEALADAGFPTEGSSPRPWALVLGGGAAGMREAEGFLARRLRSGPRARGLTELLEVPQDGPSDQVARRFSITGQRITVTTACSSSTIALGLAAELVRAGEAEVALAGGSDALCRLTFAGFNSLRAMDVEPCRPFDARRKGLSIGEGAAILVVETAERARARGARPYATVLGYGATNDAFHMTQPEPTGAAWARTVQVALQDAGVSPDSIDHINAHGTATEQNDAAEYNAYARAFGQRLSEIPLTSVKGALGHCLCAAGALEAAVTCLSIARHAVPPTVGFAVTDPACPASVVHGGALAAHISTAISSSFAFGGNSSVVVLGSCR